MVQQTTYQAVVIVGDEVPFADLIESPKGLDLRHEHKEDGGKWSLALAVALVSVSHSVGFEDGEEALSAEIGNEVRRD